MKTLIKITIFVAAISTVAISCNKNEKEIAPNVLPEETIPVEPRYLTLSIPFPAMESSDGTKVSLDPATGKTSWEEGDKIVIYGRRQTAAEPKTNIDPIIHVLTAAELANPYVAVISEDISSFEKDEEGPHAINAAYPADDWDFYSPWYSSGRAAFTNTNQILLAGYISDDNSTIKLFNLTAAIAFKVEGDFDSYNFFGNNGDETDSVA